jgi:alkylated DNA nucleotide flippase Atl1
MIPPIQEEQALATVRLHQQLARAHEDYAKALAALTGQVDVETPPALRGSLQRRLVALPAMAKTRGTTSREAAAAINGDEPNIHTTLKGLAGKGIVEIVEGSTPQRFRLAVKHRRDRVLRLSRLIEKGEWTTYGDFSIAVYESSRMGLAVARVAAHHPAFANPHRLLQAGGSVSPQWKDEDCDKGPEECKRRLTDEGVWDAAADRAEPDRFVRWETLRSRLEELDAEDEVDAAA